METVVRLVVTGRVQGVSFRAYTAREAKRLGLCGWVANRADGSVEIVAEGDSSAVAELVAWAQHGPPLARVDSVSAAESPSASGCERFEIRG